MNVGNYSFPKCTNTQLLKMFQLSEMIAACDFTLGIVCFEWFFFVVHICTPGNKVIFAHSYCSSLLWPPYSLLCMVTTLFMTSGWGKCMTSAIASSWSCPMAQGMLIYSFLSLFICFCLWVNAQRHLLSWPWLEGRFLSYHCSSLLIQPDLCVEL